LGQANAVNDRGMVEGVGDNGVLLTQQRLEETGIRIEAGGVEDRILHAEEARYLRLELLVLLLRAADEADGSHAVAIAVEPGLRRRDKFLAVSQAEVIVGAEVEELRAVGQRYACRLRRGDHT